MADGKKMITVVVPAFNEEANIEVVHRALLPVMAGLEASYDFEILFVDDHSTDGTLAALERLVRLDARVRVIRFSRNFGFQRAVFTGYLKARGDAAIEMDCDLQDPPEVILDFVRQWENGYLVVYGVRTGRQEGWLMNTARRFFYRLIDSLSEDDLPLDAGDFRLLDRRVLEELRKFEDYQPYLRGSVAALGFNQTGVPYQRAARTRGESKFPFRKLLGLALDGILNHSVVPLRIATYIGLAVSFFTLLAIVGYGVGRLFFGQDWPPGFASIIVLILGSLSLNALFLGIIGEYLGRIYKQVKRRPLTVIEREIDATTVSRAASDSRSVGYR